MLLKIGIMVAAVLTCPASLIAGNSIMYIYLSDNNKSSYPITVTGSNDCVLTDDFPGVELRLPYTFTDSEASPYKLNNCNEGDTITFTQGSDDDPRLSMTIVVQACYSGGDTFCLPDLDATGAHTQMVGFEFNPTNTCDNTCTNDDMNICIGYSTGHGHNCPWQEDG